MDTREFNKLYNNIRNPYDEEDNQSMEFGQNIKTIPTGFSFGMNPPTLPTSKPGEEPVSGNFRDFKTMMSNINPQLGYTDSNYGANISGIMNPSINAPKSYSADAYYGPEQGRYNLGITTIPTANARQLRAGYEGPYGNISFGASKDPMNKNVMLNYSNSFADGGNVVSKIKANDPNAAPLMNTPAGLVITSVKPTQKEIDDFVNQPIAMGLPIPVNEFLSGENYQDYVRRKRRETGPPLFSGSPDFIATNPSSPVQPINMPMNSYLTPTQSIYATSDNKIAKALNTAGFTDLEIKQIMDERGYADGGDVGYQYGGGAIGYSEGGLAPITAGMPIAPGYARGGYISQGQPVNTDLTRTIPPVRGPMSQGVETLFKRRYS